MARDYSTNRYKDKIKKIQQQKRTAADKRKSVADLKREVKANKKITANNKKNKANEAFGKRVQAILDAFVPKQKDPAKTLTNAQRASMARIGSVTGTARRKKLSKLAETRAMAEARVGGGKYKGKRPPQGGSGGPTATTPRYDGYILGVSKPRRRPPQGGSGGPLPKSKPAKTLTEAQKKAIRDTKQVTVKSGDTLTSIAKSKGTTVANLKKINPQIKDFDKIKPGQKIRFGGSDAPTKRISEVSKSPTRPRTIAQAQKMGKKYFYDKNGKRKAAVTAEQLKKSGLTLSQWLKKK